MLKIALPPGFKIRMCLEQGRGLGLLLKAFFLNRAFHLHCICINVMTEWRDHLWIKLCFGDDIHHTTEFNGGVFPTYIYTHMCISVYMCVLSNIHFTGRWHCHLIDAVLSFCSDTPPPSTWQKAKRNNKNQWDCAWRWLLFLLAVHIPLVFIAPVTVLCYISLVRYKVWLWIILGSA